VLFPKLTAYSDWGLLALRIAIAIIFIAHGWPKMMNPPPPSMAFFPIQGAFEVLGGAALLLGILAQLLNVGFIVIMLGAIYLKITMFSVPFMASNTTGWEFDFLILAANIALLLVGPGKLVVPIGSRAGQTAVADKYR
jgi:putative oxidoreductase